MKKEHKRTIYKIFTALFYGVFALAILLISLPVFVCDQFKIGGNSMYPTLEDGDHILVNKLLMGARIYKKYDFKDPDMECFRMPGLRKIRQGEIAVFNYPDGRDREKIEFRINYVYAKRCIGCPGDSISIVNGYYRNNNCLGTVFGDEALQHTLSVTSDSTLSLQQVYLPAFPYSEAYWWTIRDFGPMYIPGRGDIVKINPVSVKLYEMQIEFETGYKPIVINDTVFINNKPITEYQFKGNWYFFGGDNVLNSKDSRYIGLVPEDYIIGIAKHIIWKNGRVQYKKL